MTDKLECPVCQSYTSSIAQAVAYGEDCPICGASAPTILEVIFIRKSQADELLKNRAAELVVENARLTRENQKLDRMVNDARDILGEADESS